jgi:formylmethanofuran dehydrogenase subunit E
MEPVRCHKCTELIGVDDGEVYYDQKVSHEILCESCYIESRKNAPEPTKKSYYKPRGSKVPEMPPLQTVTVIGADGFREEISEEDKRSIEGLKSGLDEEGDKNIAAWSSSGSPGVRELAVRAKSKKKVTSDVFCSQCKADLLNIVHYQINDQRYCYECQQKYGR